MLLQSSDFSDENFLQVNLKITYLTTKWQQLACNASFHLKIENKYRFKRRFHKMVKHTQTIRRQIVDELFECV